LANIPPTPSDSSSGCARTAISLSDGIDGRFYDDRGFTSGADFAAVGMFDFQVADDVGTANAVLDRITTRDRPWFA